MGNTVQRIQASSRLSSLFSLAPLSFFPHPANSLGDASNTLLTQTSIPSDFKPTSDETNITRTPYNTQESELPFETQVEVQESTQEVSGEVLPVYSAKPTPARLEENEQGLIVSESLVNNCDVSTEAHRSFNSEDIKYESLITPEKSQPQIIESIAIQSTSKPDVILEFSSASVEKIHPSASKEENSIHETSTPEVTPSKDIKQPVQASPLAKSNASSLMRIEILPQESYEALSRELGLPYHIETQNESIEAELITSPHSTSCNQVITHCNGDELVEKPIQEEKPREEEEDLIDEDQESPKAKRNPKGRVTPSKKRESLLLTNPNVGAYWTPSKTARNIQRKLRSYSKTPGQGKRAAEFSLDALAPKTNTKKRGSKSVGKGGSFEDETRYLPEDSSNLRFKTNFLFDEVLDEKEGETVEYKYFSYPFNNRNLHDLRRDICAMANSRGGRIYIGVKHPAIVKGIRLTKTDMKELKEIMKDTYLDCKFIPVIEGSSFKDLFIIKLIIKQEDPKDLLYLNGKPYVRKGGESIKLGDLQKEEVIKKRRESTKIVRSSDFEDPEPLKLN